MKQILNDINASAVSGQMTLPEGLEVQASFLNIFGPSNVLIIFWADFLCFNRKYQQNNTLCMGFDTSEINLVLYYKSNLTEN